MEYLITYLLLGVFIGGIYALIGLGVVVVYKATKVFNFTVGELVIMGGCMAISLLGTGMPVWGGVILAVLAMGVVGMLIHEGVLTHFSRQSVMVTMIATCILIQVLSGVTASGWGGKSMSFSVEFLPSGNLSTGVTSIPLDLMWSFVVAMVLIAVFMGLFYYTKLGLGMRAVAETSTVAQSKGVPAKGICRLTWIIAGITAAIGGILLGYRGGINPTLALMGLKAFPVVFLGGLESVIGVIVGGVIVGVVENLVGGYVSTVWMDLSPFILLLVVLAIRPQGLFGEKRVERV